MLSIQKSLIAVGVLFAMGGCGGGSSSGDSTGTLNVAITDAAVDQVKEVWVEFSEVTLKPVDGDEIVFTFDPAKNIDLLTLQDGNTEGLLPDARVPVGEYVWMRLGVNAKFDNVFDSYVRKNDDIQVELRIPSGSETGLKLQNGFTITQDQSTNLVIDWDLRQALVDPIGQPGWYLRPALRVTDMAAYGTLQGSVAEALTMAEGCGDDATVGNAVYVYEGEVNNPLDIRALETDPLVTANVGADLTYGVSYLSEGEYTAAFTCQADLDNPEAVDDIVFSVVTTMVTIVDGETTTVDFEASAP